MVKIFAINPGSTSTKIAVYHDDQPVYVESIKHSAEEVAAYPQIADQYPMRKQLIDDHLAKNGIPLDFDVVIGRGLLFKPVEGGVYRVTPDMVKKACEAEHQHPCDLGCVLAYDIAQEAKCPMCLIADPGVVDELCDEARVSGSPLMPRAPLWHALNQRAVSRKYAKSIGKRYEDLNLIVTHLGGGISVTAHCHGRAIDTNNALDGDGPFSPERAGTLPACDLVKICFSGKYTEAELLKRIVGKAGVTAHLGTNDMKEVISRIERGDKHAELIVKAMAFNVAKQIASESAALYGKVDAIILTGGLAYNQYFVDLVKQRVSFLAPVVLYPGENEMESLAYNALNAYLGQIEVKDY